MKSETVTWDEERRSEAAMSLKRRVRAARLNLTRYEDFFIVVTQAPYGLAWRSILSSWSSHVV